MDGDGDIDYAEFARIMTADDIIYLKNTLVADVKGTGGTVVTTKAGGLKAGAVRS